MASPFSWAEGVLGEYGMYKLLEASIASIAYEAY